ncbi:F-box/kelch-repeat protein At3g23880-like [Lotus japonicus]|uniref:F-box/kelch-repeat protein At3g23880-like n=1 Tax=Lotus japonicus TaxID=34305 RepID=UPI002584C6F2|nr:F-box/kelch-repeat protein At3g23880-like [Lotus japonicus]
MNNPHVVPILPSELVEEIISRLPVKTLMQLISVSKSWKSLIIDDPKFAKLHLKNSPKKTHFIINFEDEIDYIDVDTCFISCSVQRFLKEPSSTVDEGKCYRLKGTNSVVGSCNGLVCLGNFYDVALIKEFWVQLWNPVMRLSSKKSPTLKINSQTEEFGPCDKMNYGFGYDDSHDAYKVVVVFWNCTEQKMETMVHCMGDSCWRKKSSDPNFPLLLKQVNGQFVGGCLNWLALDKVNDLNYQWNNVTLKNLVIVSFDMRDEIYKFISLPEGVRDVPHVEPDLGILGNHMCLFHHSKRAEIVVWQMREYGVQKSWTQLVRIGYQDPQCDDSVLRPLSMCLSEDGDFLLLTYAAGVVIFMCKLRDNSVEYTELPDKDWLSISSYVPSLIAP